MVDIKDKQTQLSQDTRHYSAFVSYSHHDTADAIWLTRKLESWRIPRHCRNNQADKTGEIGKATLGPIFRDRDELPAAHSLGEPIKNALANSDWLIVLCSPHSAQSKWVNEEIAEFTRLGKSKNILAVIIDGEPFGSETGTGPECFPENLRYRLTEDGTLSPEQAEPCAADFRPDKDGRKLGFTKLAAGMLGVNLDDLIRRDLIRKNRTVTAVTAASIAGMLVMSTLAFTAWQGQREAEHQRAEAEGLIEFMLTDLRDKLEPVGRLDVLNAVAIKANEYYLKQDSKLLNCDSARRKARALYEQAGVFSSRKNFTEAQILAEQATELSVSRYNKCRNNPNFLINYSHSLQWLNYVKIRILQEKNLSQNQHLTELDVREILAGYEKSKMILKNIKELDFPYSIYARELADTDRLIGSVYKDIGNSKKALEFFNSAHDIIHPVWLELGREPDSTAPINNEAYQVIDNLADTLTWISSIQIEMKEYDKAARTIDLYQTHYQSLEKSLDFSAANWDARFQSLGGDLKLSRIDVAKEKYNDAWQRLLIMEQEVKNLVAQDKSNNDWVSFLSKIHKTKNEVRKHIN